MPFCRKFKTKTISKDIIKRYNW